MKDRVHLLSFLIGLVLCLTVFAILGAAGVARGPFTLADSGGDDAALAAQLEHKALTSPEP